MGEFDISSKNANISHWTVVPNSNKMLSNLFPDERTAKSSAERLTTALVQRGLLTESDTANITIVPAKGGWRVACTDTKGSWIAEQAVASVAQSRALPHSAAHHILETNAAPLGIKKWLPTKDETGAAIEVSEQSWEVQADADAAGRELAIQLVGLGTPLEDRLDLVETHKSALGRYHLVVDTEQLASTRYKPAQPKDPLLKSLDEAVQIAGMGKLSARPAPGFMAVPARGPDGKPVSPDLMAQALSDELQYRRLVLAEDSAKVIATRTIRGENYVLVDIGALATAAARASEAPWPTREELKRAVTKLNMECEDAQLAGFLKPELRARYPFIQSETQFKIVGGKGGRYEILAYPNRRRRLGKIKKPADGNYAASLVAMDALLRDLDIRRNP